MSKNDTRIKSFIKLEMSEISGEEISGYDYPTDNLYPYPDVSRTEINKNYEPKLKSLIDLGSKLNTTRQALEHFEDLTNQNSNLSNTNDNINNSDGSTYNLNREILLRKEQLNTLENDELNNQFSKMQNLQSTIFTKERLIEENLIGAEKNERNIRVLAGTILLSIILFVIISMYGGGSIDDKKLVTLCIVILIVFIIFIMYQYNIMYLGDSLGYIFSFQFLSSVGSQIEQKTQDFQQDINQVKYGDYDTWKAANCGSCPSDNVDEVSYVSELSLPEVEYSPAFFYQDGSAPNQIIVDRSNLPDDYDNVINYLDYNSSDSSNGTITNNNLVSPTKGALVGSTVFTTDL